MKRIFFIAHLRWLYFNQRTLLSGKTKFWGDYTTTRPVGHSLYCDKTAMDASGIMACSGIYG
ncbi:hypothetical protein DET57_1511 [Klebsiella oxytoca]|uniref:Uncharacterized protein n=1 Tax=Klebsiella oxytoca TaxID=571 RepID=A0A318F1U0_KLEOX|nr:hypothetical protein DET57_1511 [Klebsiella oxytoca]